MPQKTAPSIKTIFQVLHKAWYLGILLKTWYRYNERFSDAKDERDPDENFLNEVNTQNFECSYLVPNEIESFLSEKKNSETINAIHVNIRSLSKNFDNLDLKI